jgi:hypothetical protein
MDDEDLERREADRLLAAAIYLMSCHARNQCPRLACMVRCHLQQIARHRGAGKFVGDICRRMSSAWEAIRQHDERAVLARIDPSHRLQ